MTDASAIIGSWRDETKMRARRALPPIRARIRSSYEKSRDYATMLCAVFPPELFPKAHRISNNGGPPGCAMAFGKALREMGGRRDGDRVWLPVETTKRN